MPARRFMKWLGGACLAVGLAGCQPASKPVQMGAGKAASVTKPQRIVSLNLCTDQLLLQLVEPQRIAAISNIYLCLII